MTGDNPAVMRGGEVASPVHEEGNASVLDEIRREEAEIIEVVKNGGYNTS